MRSSFFILRVGLILDGKRTVFVSKPALICETSTRIRKLAIDPKSNNVLYYSSKNFSDDETYQLSRIVISHTGSVISNGHVDFDDQTGCGKISGFLPEFTIFSEGNERRIVFVDADSYKMYKGKLDEAGRVVNCQIMTSLTDGVIKDVSFARGQHYKTPISVYLLLKKSDCSSMHARHLSM